MKNSGIEKETDIIHLHCSYGNHQFTLNKRTLMFFTNQKLQKSFNRLFKRQKRSKKWISVCYAV